MSIVLPALFIHLSFNLYIYFFIRLSYNLPVYFVLLCNSSILSVLSVKNENDKKKKKNKKKGKTIYLNDSIQKNKDKSTRTPLKPMANSDALEG